MDKLDKCSCASGQLLVVDARLTVTRLTRLSPTRNTIRSFLSDTSEILSRPFLVF